ncbi:MAG: MotA/TolQ/ExbB proton channel family protein [Phycisphaerae bacterium]
MELRRNLLFCIIAMLAGLAFAPPATAQDAPAQATPAEAPADAPAAEAAAPEAAAPDTPADAEITQGQAFLRKLVQGGLTMLALLIVSIFGLAFTVERFFNLRRSNVAPRDLLKRVDGLFAAGKYAEARKLAAGSDTTLGRMLGVLARHPESDTASLSTLAGDAAARDLKKHMQKAYALAVVATLSPLLGLFGTVVGMIGAFDKVAAAGAMGDASILGGDISKALITTGAGLAVAVPALGLYHYFRSKVNLFAIELEEDVGELIADRFAGRRAPAVDATTGTGGGVPKASAPAAVTAGGSSPHRPEVARAD